MGSKRLVGANDTGDWPHEIVMCTSQAGVSVPGQSRPDARSPYAPPPGSGLVPEELRAEISLADRLREQIAFFDSGWTLVAVNQAWADATLRETHPTSFPGSNYLAWCEQLAAEGDEAARATAEALRRIDAGEIGHFDQVDSGARARSGHTYQTRIYAFGEPSRQWRAVARYDMTELITLKQQKRQLGSKLLHAESEERRRVARDLHDTTSQDLVALQLTLANLKRGQRLPFQKGFADADEALERLQREIRGMSYLFHSRWTEEKGFDQALEEMVHGFARRSGIQIRLSVDDTEGVDRRLGLAVHRIIQEALANVQRHAKASEVDVKLIGTQRRLHIMIRDNGSGFTSEGLRADAAGVGLCSMRERVQELGGLFKLKTGATGTSITASLPLQDEQA